MVNQFEQIIATECNNSYANYQHFYNEVQKSFKPESHVDPPKLFKDVVFLNVTDLLKALGKAGIIFEFDDSYIKKAYVTPKEKTVDAEIARQLALTCCSSQGLEPVVSMVTHSNWNRFLPQVIQGYPQQNQF